MLKYVEGNIITGDYEIFCQQVNCKHKMGAGLAKQIRDAYPEVYDEYMQTEPKLGRVLAVPTTDRRVCINMYAQDGYGKDKRYTDYEAFKKCLSAIAEFAKHIEKDITIAFPYGIGCGLGGGDWNIIQGMIKDFSETIPQKVVIVNLK